MRSTERSSAMFSKPFKREEPGHSKQNFVFKVTFQMVTYDIKKNTKISPSSEANVIETSA